MESILQTLGLAGIAMGALVYLARQVVLSIFVRDSAEHKANLDKEVQRYTHELTSLRQQFQIQFSKTYEKQIDAIRQLYDGMRHLLNRLEFVHFHIVLGETYGGNVAKDVGEAINKAAQAHSELKLLHDDNDIYLPESLSNKMGGFLEILSNAVESGTLRPSHCSDQVIRNWKSLWEKTGPQAKALQAELKSEFRRLQGVDAFKQ